MAITRKKKNHSPNYDYVACCFQGGGAMGAYQVGVLQSLQEANYHPNWFVGTSIGAINSAIAAGNPIEKRIEKMRQFWETIATPALLDESLLPNDRFSRRMQHYFSSQSAILFGQPGFYKPRSPFDPLSDWKTPVLSYYDTSPLRQTLEKFVDFDRINSSDIRLSVGAVEISSGKMHYFDSEKDCIRPEHIMASGALPPGFPPVEVDGKLYWDGGLSSNTPLSYVLENHNPRALLCFMVHLFDSYGLDPQTLDEVSMRCKDIEYSSRFAKLVKMHQEIHSLRYKIHQLSKKLPSELKKSDFVKKCMHNGWDKTACLVRFLYQGDDDDLSSKDYEFSQKSIKEHIEMGYNDGQKSVLKSPWLKPVPKDSGIVIYDMAESKTIGDPS